MAVKALPTIAKDAQVVDDCAGDAPINEGVQSEFEAAVWRIQEQICPHMLPLMGLASGHTSLDDKVHALLQALHHEMGSETLEQFMRCAVVSFTTDWGTESGLVSVPATAFARICPQWQSSGAFFDEDEYASPRGGAGPQWQSSGAFFDEDAHASPRGGAGTEDFFDDDGDHEVAVARRVFGAYSRGRLGPNT